MNQVYSDIFQLLESIKKEPRTSKKVELLKSFPHQKVLREFLYLVYDPHVVFGITSKAFKPKNGGMLKEIDPSILAKVVDIQGRNNKIRYIDTATAWINKTAREYIIHALDKDLKIGIGIKLINKAFEEECVSDFQVMKAHKQTEERYVSNFSNLPWFYYNLKVDGVRCIVDVKSKEKIEFFSRDGKEMEPFLVENIKAEISKNCDIFMGRKLDCEIYSNHFQKLMRIYRRKNVDMNSVYIRNSTRLAIFDLIDEGEQALTYRVKTMQRMEEELGKNTFIKFLKYHVINEPDYLKVGKIARKYIAAGKEGIIIKHPFVQYEFKRSNYWLKFKNKETLDLKVIGYFKGEEGTEFENALGGLILNFKGNELRCGSGFTKEERFKLWENPDELIGETVEISYMEETKTGSLRHPVFERFRFDK